MVIWFFYEKQSLNDVKTFTNSQFRALSVVIFDRNLANAPEARRSLGVGTVARPTPPGMAGDDPKGQNDPPAKAVWG